jgi:hypothetical protein
MWSVPRSYLGDNWSDEFNCQLIAEFCTGAVKLKPKSVKLKNLNC